MKYSQILTRDKFMISRDLKALKDLKEEVTTDKRDLMPRQSFM